MQFNMSQSFDLIFNAIHDLLELPEYARMSVSSSQVVIQAYVVCEKKPILL